MKKKVVCFQVKRLFVPLFLALMAGLLINRYSFEKYAVFMGIGGMTVLIIYYGFTLFKTINTIAPRKALFDNNTSIGFFIMIIVLFLMIGHRLYDQQIEKDPMRAFLGLQPIIMEGHVERVWERDFATDYEFFSRRLTLNGQEFHFREKQNLRIYGIDHGYNRGDQIKISNPMILNLNEIQAAEARTPQKQMISSYDLYLKSRGFHNRLQARPGDVELIVKEVVYHDSFLARNRWRALNFLDQSLQEPQNQLMKSVLFGNQNFLEEELRKTFSQTGTAHIIAVSGLHVGILVLIFTMLFKTMGLGKKHYLWFILGILFFYGALVGFPISMVRAGMMYGLYILAFYQQRPYDGLHAIAVVGVVSLLINPLTLFTVSFQLSFAATASIILLYPKLERGLFFLPKSLRGLVAVTLAAQLGTLPLMAYYFGQISIISIIANILLMPTMGMLLSLGILGIFVSFIALPLGMVVNYFTNGLLTYQITIVRLLQKIPGAFIETSALNFTWVILYYILTIILYLLLLRFNAKPLFFYRLRASSTSSK